MSSSDIAISVRGLGKAYTIRHAAARAPTTLAEAMLDRLRHPLGRAQEKEEFWALRDVSFDVKRGEVVGVIGRNGAGKSTLLKILSRITEPTTGEVDLYGRVGSLLEVGTGFHQELSGRENIFLNGAILGMTRAEIRKQFDAIVDFAGVEKFLDTPVKRYSSGMYVRLAFAVAAHLRSEILIVDEVLAVGDAEFQKKCMGKMKEVSTDGRTVLFVSHNMASVAQLSNSAILLMGGILAAKGPVDACLVQYTQPTAAMESAERVAFAILDRRLSKLELTVDGQRHSRVAPRENSELRLRLSGVAEQRMPMAIEGQLLDYFGRTIACFTPWREQGECPLVGPGSFELAMRLTLPRLNRGVYQLVVSVTHPARTTYARLLRPVEVVAAGVELSGGVRFDANESNGFALLAARID